MNRTIEKFYYSNPFMVISKREKRNFFLWHFPLYTYIYFFIHNSTWFKWMHSRLFLVRMLILISFLCKHLHQLCHNNSFFNLYIYILNYFDSTFIHCILSHQYRKCMQFFYVFSENKIFLFYSIIIYTHSYTAGWNTIIASIESFLFSKFF